MRLCIHPVMCAQNLARPYVCIYATHVVTRVCTSVCTYARIYECVATRVYVHVYVHTWCVYMHACVYTPPTPPCQIQNGGVHVCQRGRGAP